jgi:hypothetical protein
MGIRAEFSRLEALATNRKSEIAFSVPRRVALIAKMKAPALAKDAEALPATHDPRQRAPALIKLH